jgi:RNA polymerase sigma-70 factor (ECF subfamily)
MSKRTNEQWLSELSSSGPAQEAALVDLRVIVQARLPYALSTWLSQNDPRYAALEEEVLQETLLRVLARLDTFQGRSQFTTWVHTIAVRIALTELRRAKWRDVSLDEMIETVSGEHPVVEVLDSATKPEAEVERAELLARVRKIIMEELTDRQRQAIMAAGIHGLPLEEVAWRMGTNRNALYKTMHDGRLQIKRRLAREGLTVEDIFGVFEQG